MITPFAAPPGLPGGEPYRLTLFVNGASDLLERVLGCAGVGARSAFGVSNLPFDSPVEIEAITVGRKGRDALRRAGVPIAAHFSQLGDRPAFSDITAALGNFQWRWIAPMPSISFMVR